MNVWGSKNRSLAQIASPTICLLAVVGLWCLWRLPEFAVWLVSP